MDSCLYEVTVWNMATGDVVKRIREATEEELSMIEMDFNEPEFHVVAEPLD